MSTTCLTDQDHFRSNISNVSTLRLIAQRERINVQYGRSRGICTRKCLRGVVGVTGVGFCRTIECATFMVCLSNSEGDRRFIGRCRSIANRTHRSCYIFTDLESSRDHADLKKFRNTVVSNCNTIEETINLCLRFQRTHVELNVSRSCERDEVSADNSVSKRLIIKLFCYNCSSTSSGCYTSVKYLSCSVSKSCSGSFKESCITSLEVSSLNSGSSFRTKNFFLTSPVINPGVPDSRSKTSLRINVKSSSCSLKCLSEVAFCLNNICLKSYLVSPGVRGGKKFQSTNPETNDERCYTFSSSSKGLLQPLSISIIKSDDISSLLDICSIRFCET